MLTMKKIALLTASLGLMATLVGCGEDKKVAQAPELIPIGIAQIVEHAALDASRDGIIQGLKERGFEDGKNIRLDLQNAQGDQSNLNNIMNRFVNDKDEIIFAIATPVAQAAAAKTKTTPIVATAVTNFEVAKLVDSNEKPGRNVTGVSDINPVADQLKLMLRLKPETKTVGVIFNASEVNSEFQVKLLKEAAQKEGIEIVEATVTNVNDIVQAAQSLVGKVDGIFAPTDNVISSGLPALLKVAIPAKLPVIDGEGEPVRGGCLASIAVDYFELGRMTGHMGADILEGKAKPADMPIQMQSTDKVIINTKTAKAIGMTIPEEILKNAEKVGE